MMGAARFFGFSWLMTHIFLALVIAATAIAALSGMFVFIWSVPTWRIFGPVLIRGPATGKQVALTFDDGPSPPFTDQILDILRDRQVPATFFVCGKNAERHPETLRRIHMEGHTIGNHTYSHPFLYFRSRSFMSGEIDHTQEVIERIIGQRPSCFRPPYGGRWTGLNSILRQRGLHLVQWSDTGYDWKLETEGIIRESLKGLGPGSILLLHDGLERRPPRPFDQSRTVRALPAIIDAARQAGLTFVPVTEFLAPSNHGRTPSALT